MPAPMFSIRHQPTRDARASRETGFSLIELLVVIIIVGVLAAIAIPVFLNQRQKGVDAGIKSDLRALALAEEAWLTDNPDEDGTTDVTALRAAGFKSSKDNVIYVALNATKGGYCIIGANPNASKARNGSNWYIIWDSTGPGMINNGNAFYFNSYPAGSDSCAAGRGGWVNVSSP